MPVGELRLKAWRIIERACNAGDLLALGELYTADVVQHRPPLADIEGLGALLGDLADLQRTFSQAHLAFDQLIFEGDAHASRWTFRGIHTGRSQAMPVPATGKQVVVMGCSVAHWLEGRIDEEWVYTDWLGLFRQLGVIPPME